MFEQCNGLQQEMKMNKIKRQVSIDTKERKNDMCLYSVVVPVYNSEHTLQELYTRLEKSIPGNDKRRIWTDPCRWRVQGPVFAVMQELREKDPRVKIESRWQGILDSILRFCADLPTQRESSS